MSSITAPSPAVDPAGPLASAARGRRRSELIMLVFAFALVLFAAWLTPAPVRAARSGVQGGAAVPAIA